MNPSLFDPMDLSPNLELTCCDLSDLYDHFLLMNKTGSEELTLQVHGADCSLRQGAGGTEFACFGSRTCFLMWLYKRSQTYFGQKSEEHIKTIKKRCLEVKNNDFLEKHVT